MTEETQAQAAQRLYDQRGLTYEDSHHPSFTANFVKFAKIETGQRVLDLACGTGLVTFLASEAVGAGGEVIGVDISTGMLEQAKARKERESEKFSNVRFFQHDIIDLGDIVEIEEASFDFITIASALVLLKDAKAAVTGWVKYLKRGGKFVTDANHPQNFIDGMVIERVGSRLGAPVPYHRDWVKGEESLPELLRDAGLEVERCIPMASTGQGTMYYDLSDADNVFISKVITSEAARHLGAASLRDRARKMFKEEWLKVADDNDKIAEIDCTYVAVAKRP
ncbi:MAG: hypothetical protein M1821_001127 [Bathelium mastoideum]|nr:MAG: hypothetical protein M1821_001127 [Bathelium mastoideum]KAI9693845.1 MAG: hypothetical protein M1822_003116 [Bathelium mastoideum]